MKKFEDWYKNRLNEAFPMKEPQVPQSPFGRWAAKAGQVGVLPAMLGAGGDIDWDKAQSLQHANTAPELRRKYDTLRQAFEKDLLNYIPTHELDAKTQQVVKHSVAGLARAFTNGGAVRPLDLHNIIYAAHQAPSTPESLKNGIFDRHDNLLSHLRGIMSRTPKAWFNPEAKTEEEWYNPNMKWNRKELESYIDAWESQKGGAGAGDKFDKALDEFIAMMQHTGVKLPQSDLERIGQQIANQMGQKLTFTDLQKLMAIATKAAPPTAPAPAPAP